MRSGAFKAGQFNLKGKKEVLLSCKCCVVRDLRQKEIDRIHNKEIEASVAERYIYRGCGGTEYTRSLKLRAFKD